MEVGHLTNEGRAVEYLASELSKGTLLLVLGAGASAEVGLPGWAELLRRCRGKMGLPIDKAVDGASAEVLQQLADDLERQRFKDNPGGLAQLVKQELYDGVDLGGSFAGRELLVALGALMMGSRRGSASRVITFNYDSVLEWYMSLCGFVSRVVVRPPGLEGAEDVRVYHPHGFLPHPGMLLDDSPEIVLGLSKLNERLGTPGDTWNELMRHLFGTGVALFIGLSVRSFRDRAIAPVLAFVGKQKGRTGATGIWLLADKLDPDQSLDDLRAEFGAVGVALLALGKDRMPGFLLRVCAQAAGKVQM